MSNQELQDEEREVILSIYDGDPAFNQLSPITYQYKYGVDGDARSCLVEIVWSENYPTEIPVINLDTFYNNHLVSSVKEKIADLVLKEAEQWIGTAMTYTLFESVKEHFEELITEQPVLSSENKESEDKDDKEINFNEPGAKKEKKEQLSKAQKRKQWDRVDSRGERARGWNWVDVVQHLSQTGPKPTVLTS